VCETGSPAPRFVCLSATPAQSLDGLCGGGCGCFFKEALINFDANEDATARRRIPHATHLLACGGAEIY
jgi:hypothetical protein